MGACGRGLSGLLLPLPRFASYPVCDLFYCGSGWEGRLKLERTGRVKGPSGGAYRRVHELCVVIRVGAGLWNGLPSFPEAGVGSELCHPSGFRSV